MLQLQEKPRRVRSKSQRKLWRAQAIAKNPEAWRQRVKAEKLAAYGLTRAGYDALLSSQGGVCKICRKGPGARSLNVDHDHVTGQVRGLLCASCNRALGMFRDDPVLLAAAIDYLKASH